MKHLTVRMTEPERATIRQAAQACGVGMAEYCRRVLLADATHFGTNGKDSVPVMVRQIRDHLLAITAAPTWGSEGAAAVEVLVKTGHERGAAEKRVRAICTGQPELKADAIVALAFKAKGD